MSEHLTGRKAIDAKYKWMVESLADGSFFDQPHACFCVGPQPGETQCPCQLGRLNSGDARRLLQEAMKAVERLKTRDTE